MYPLQYTLRQRKKHILCLFVVPKATECRKAYQRDSCVSTYPVFQGYSFEMAGYSTVTSTFLDQNSARNVSAV